MTMTLAAVLVLSALVGGLLADNIALRRRLHRRDVEAAELTAQVLGGNVVIDGVTLPSPSDTRWRRTQRLFEDKSAAWFLICGDVLIEERSHAVFIKEGSSLPTTRSMVDYGKQCWNEARSRWVTASLKEDTRGSRG